MSEPEGYEQALEASRLINRIIDQARAEGRASERQHLTTCLRMMAENFADDVTAYAVLRGAADLLDGGE